MMLRGTPLGRTGAPQDIAEAVAFLASRPLRLDHRRDAGGHGRLPLRPHPRAAHRRYAACNRMRDALHRSSAPARSAASSARSLEPAGHDVAFIECNREHVRGDARRRPASRRCHSTTIRARADPAAGGSERRRCGPVLLAVKAPPYASRRWSRLARCSRRTATWSRCRTGSRNTRSPPGGRQRARSARSSPSAAITGRPARSTTAAPAPSASARSTAHHRPRWTTLRDALVRGAAGGDHRNIFGFLWAKMALGAIYFATALVSADVPEIYASESYRRILAGLPARW